MSKEQKASKQRPVKPEPKKETPKQISPVPMENIKPHPFWFYLIMIAIIIVIDQCLKLLVEKSIAAGSKIIIVDQYLDITNVHNTGAAFNFMADQPSMIMAITSGIIAVGFYFLYIFRGNPLIQTFIALVLGGANGNLFDRVSRGYVVDYIDIHFIPVFNFADICVTIGVLFLCIMVSAINRGRVGRG